MQLDDCHSIELRGGIRLLGKWDWENTRFSISTAEHKPQELYAYQQLLLNESNVNRRTLRANPRVFVAARLP